MAQHKPLIAHISRLCLLETAKNAQNPMRKVSLMRLSRLVALFATFIFYQPANAQDNILTWEEYYQQILAYHPVVVNANINLDLAGQELRFARGFFDPMLIGDYKQKQFSEKDYYRLLTTKVSVPLWIGELEAGYYQNEGEFLNPENLLPRNGQSFVGVSIPLAQGLLIDERRSTLRQARYLTDIAEAERLSMINKLLLSATKDYWNWYFAYQRYRFVQEAYRLAEIRYEAVKLSVITGDQAPIDSVEAKISLQNRDIELQQSAIELKNARLIASNHLWGEGETPLEILETTLPDDFDLARWSANLPQAEALVAQAEEQHPDLRKIIFKNRQLDVERSLQVNKLAPKINLQYHLLSEPQAVSGDQYGWSTQNYMLGLKVAFPLFLRQERGKLQLVRLKQVQLEQENLQTRREIINTVLAQYNLLNNIAELIGLQESMVNNYQQLLRGEQLRFENGESSIFLINVRETQLLDSQVKLVKLHSDYGKARAELNQAVGLVDWDY